MKEDQTRLKIKWDYKTLDADRLSFWTDKKTRALFEFIGLLNAENLSIFELGCGTGFMSNLINLHTRKSSITGLDLDQSLIDYAASHYKAQNQNSMKFVTGNIYDTGFQDNLFDLCLTHFVICNLDKVKEAIDEVIRVVKSNGEIVFIEPMNSMQKFYNGNKAMPDFIFKANENPKRVIRYLKRKGTEFDAGITLMKVLQSYKNIKIVDMLGFCHMETNLEAYCGGESAVEQFLLKKELFYCKFIKSYIPCISYIQDYAHRIYIKILKETGRKSDLMHNDTTLRVYPFNVIKVKKI
jgi:ubiquinone/menaquinone biosynthesis C-methylase UbiE